MGSFIKSSGTGISGTLALIGNMKNVKANKDALKADRKYTQKGANELVAGQQGAIDQYQPYADTAPQSLATLLSAIYGGEQAYTDANGVRQVASYSPQESEGFQYTKARTLEDLGRSLRMMGRGSGTTAANATGRTLGNLNAENEQLQFSRLGNLLDLGRWGRTGIADAKFTGGNNLASLFSGLGKSQAAGYRSLGDARNRLWSDQAKWNYQGASDAGDGFNEYMSMKSGMGGGMGGSGGMGG